MDVKCRESIAIAISKQFVCLLDMKINFELINLEFSSVHLSSGLLCLQCLQCKR